MQSIGNAASQLKVTWIEINLSTMRGSHAVERRQTKQ